MTIVIVPNELRNAIYEKIDTQIALVPDAAPDREYFYHSLLEYFNIHGVIPEFSLEKKA